jgi:host factor-I protein
MNKGVIHLQDNFLNQVRKDKIPVTVFLTNGFDVKGVVTGFDNFTLVLDNEDRNRLVYKHAIASIVPVRKINYYNKESD